MNRIDAVGNDRLGRFVNDLPKGKANCIAKAMFINKRPHVLLFAAKYIKAGDELRFDYGGDDLPWRKVCILSYSSHIHDYKIELDNDRHHWCSP